jgi:hypothetical protein
MNSSSSALLPSFARRTTRASLSPVSRGVTGRVTAHAASAQASASPIRRLAAATGISGDPFPGGAWTFGLLDHLKLPPLTRYHE